MVLCVFSFSVYPRNRNNWIKSSRTVRIVFIRLYHSGILRINIYTIWYWMRITHRKWNCIEKHALPKRVKPVHSGLIRKHGIHSEGKQTNKYANDKWKKELKIIWVILWFFSFFNVIFKIDLHIHYFEIQKFGNSIKYSNRNIHIDNISNNNL